MIDMGKATNKTKMKAILNNISVSVPTNIMPVSAAHT